MNRNQIESSQTLLGITTTVFASEIDSDFSGFVPFVPGIGGAELRDGATEVASTLAEIFTALWRDEVNRHHTRYM